MPPDVGESGAGPTERRRTHRRRRTTLVFVERRTGFDRRLREHRSPVSRAVERLLRLLHDRPAALLALLLGVNCLNVLDLGLTFRALNHGAVEANPLMRALLDYNAWVAVAFKLILVWGISAVIWVFRRFRDVLLISLLILLVFCCIFLYQLFGPVRII